MRIEKGEVSPRVVKGNLSRRFFGYGGLACLTWPALFQPARADPQMEAVFVPLGGLDQWISIRGTDPANPVLLVVHGGPGDVQWPFIDKYREWEKAFTVVLWDQRGAGRTYGRSGGDKTPDVRLARIVQDGLELSDYLRRRLGKKKIIVLGHSWGSIVADEMAQARPDLFAAYVGTGQVESWKASVNYQFDLLLARAKATHDETTLKELEGIGRPDPANTQQYFGFTRNYRSVMCPSDQGWLNSLRPLFVAHKDDKDYQDVANGMEFSGKSVLPDQIRTDLTLAASMIDTAFFVIQGADDVITPTPLAIDYFKGVRAPVKKLVLIPDSGHFAFLTNTDSFLAGLIGDVRPVAIARGA